MSSPDPSFVQPTISTRPHPGGAGPAPNQMESLVRALSRDVPSLFNSYASLRRAEASRDAALEVANQRRQDVLGPQLAQRFQTFEEIAETQEFQENEDPRLIAIIQDSLGDKDGRSFAEELKTRISVDREFDNADDQEFDQSVLADINARLEGATPEYEAGFRQAIDQNMRSILTPRRNQQAARADAERELGVRGLIQTGVAEALNAGEDLAFAESALQESIDIAVEVGGLGADQFEEVVDAVLELGRATNKTAILDILPHLSIDGVPLTYNDNFTERWITAKAAIVKERRDQARDRKEARELVEDDISIRALEHPTGESLPQDLIDEANAVGFDVVSLRNRALQAQQYNSVSQDERDELWRRAGEGQLTILEAINAGVGLDEAASLGRLVNNVQRSGNATLDNPQVQSFVRDQISLVQAVSLPEDKLAQLTIKYNRTRAEQVQEYNLLVSRARSTVRRRLEARLQRLALEQPYLMTADGAEDYEAVAERLAKEITEPQIQRLREASIRTLEGTLPLSNPDSVKIHRSSLNRMIALNDFPDAYVRAWELSEQKSNHGMSLPRWLASISIADPEVEEDKE